MLKLIVAQDNSGKTPEDVATCEEVLEVLKHHSRRDTGGGGFIDSCPKCVQVRSVWVVYKTAFRNLILCEPQKLEKSTCLWNYMTIQYAYILVAMLMIHCPTGIMVCEWAVVFTVSEMHISMAHRMPYSKTTEKWDKELAELSSDALRYPKRSAEGGMQLLHRVLLQVAQASCPEGKWLGGGMGTGIPALVQVGPWILIGLLVSMVQNENRAPNAIVAVPVVWIRWYIESVGCVSHVQMLSEVMPASLQIHIRAVREQAVLVQTGHRPNEKADTHNPRHAVEVCQVVADLMDWAVVNPAQQGGYSNFERKSFMLSRDLDRAEPKHIITWQPPPVVFSGKFTSNHCARKSLSKECYMNTRQWGCWSS